MFWIMPVDNERCRAEIGNFNKCLHYAFNKLKINLFNIMTSVSQVLVFLLAIQLYNHSMMDNYELENFKPQYLLNPIHHYKAEKY